MLDEKKVNENAEELEDDFDGEVIELENEDGETMSFYHVATFDLDDKWYVAFQPTEDTEELSEDEVVFFELGQDEDGEDLFLPVEDEDLQARLYDEFSALVEEDCDCEDCGCEECADGACDCNSEGDKE